MAGDVGRTGVVFAVEDEGDVVLGGGVELEDTVEDGVAFEVVAVDFFADEGAGVGAETH